MVDEMGALFVKLIGTMAVLVVIALFVSQKDVPGRLTDGRRFVRYIILSGLVGGLLGIYGNLAGMNINGAIVSIRDLGPMLAGVSGGPVGGLIAGLIAGLHRLTLGGLTAQPCIIATCLIGLICGTLSLKFPEQISKPKWALLLAALMECMHLGIVILMVSPINTAVELVGQIALPFVSINAVGFMAILILADSVEKRRKMTEERSRIESELNTASVIQHAMLPPITERFPGREEIDVAASMKAAKAVGGDFYDLFFVNKDTFAVVIADVSGKGIPAALFMANAKQTIQDCVRDVAGLSEAVTTANERLCENNEMDMFVTAWIGLLDLNTGQLRYVNAGHNPPVIITADGAEYQRNRHGFILAGMEGIRYKEQTVKLEPDEVLFLYTDGVTEAENSQEAFYGEERLLSCLQKTGNADAGTILDETSKDLAAYVDGYDQFDDITMLCVKYQPQSSSSVGT